MPAFARCLTRTVGEDRAADARVGAQLGQLVAAFGANDPDVIRREAEAVVAVELHEARESAALDPRTQLHNRASLDSQLERVADLSFLMSTISCGSLRRRGVRGRGAGFVSARRPAASRARASVDRRNRVQQGQRPFSVTASVGVAVLGPGDTGKTWLARADAALYEAKPRGVRGRRRRHSAFAASVAPTLTAAPQPAGLNSGGADEPSP